MNERFNPASPLGKAIFWLCLVAYGLHVIEEYDLGWKPWAERTLTRWMQTGRVRWVGHLQGQHYVQWLQSSWCHVYLTQPFVASWSLVEALACGCPLVGSNVSPVREFCDSRRAWLVDHRQPRYLRKPLVEVMEGKMAPHTLGTVAPLSSHLSLATCLGRWRRVLGQQVPTQA